MTQKLLLEHLGFTASLREELIEYNSVHKKDYTAGRVTMVQRDGCEIFTDKGVVKGIVAGRLFYDVNQDSVIGVGDWVIIERIKSDNNRVVIHKVMQRFSKFGRKVAGGRYDEQLIACNINFLFICVSLNNDFNVRRLERYLTMVWSNGATPVIVLTKRDLIDNIDFYYNQISDIALGVNIHAISSVTGEGIDGLTEYLNPGVTIAVIGSSGVGKSTLINYLAQKKLFKTNDVRNKDNKGRHTTTHRELVLLDNGGIIIDTPGMREFHLLGEESSVDSTFSDIKMLATHCRFNNCSHMVEPGCAVKLAISNGELSKERLNNYFKLLKEAAFMRRKERRKLRKSQKK